MPLDSLSISSHDLRSRGACEIQVLKFEQIFGTEPVLITKVGLIAAEAGGLDVKYFIHELSGVTYGEWVIMLTKPRVAEARKEFFWASPGSQEETDRCRIYRRVLISAFVEMFDLPKE